MYNVSRRGEHLCRLADEDMGSVLAARQVRKERPQPAVGEPELGDSSEGQSSVRRRPPWATPGACAVVLTAECSAVFQGGVLKTVSRRVRWWWGGGGVLAVQNRKLSTNLTYEFESVLFSFTLPEQVKGT